MDWSMLLLRIAVIIYCLAFVNSLVPVLGGGRRTLGLTPWLAALGCLTHTGALVALGLRLQRCPLQTLPEVLSVLAWAAVPIYLFAHWRYGLEVLHVIILPLVLLVLFVANLVAEPLVPVAPALAPVVLRFHLTVIVLAVAALFLAFAASLVYVLIDRALKSKRPARFFLRLPPLERCDLVAGTALLWAFPLLTLGIITGAIANVALGNAAWAWQQRETLAILAWVILGIVVVARLGWGWRGRNAALLTITGFSALLLRMLGVY